jgi:hypothetical protein
MTRNEIVQRNISLSFDFIRHLVKSPELLESIPVGAEVEFVEHDLPQPVGPESGNELSNAVLFKVERAFREIRGPNGSDESVAK